MKKIISLLCVLMLTLPVFAETIGAVDYMRVMANYSKAKRAYNELDDQASSLQRYLLDKENEYKKIETPLQRKTFEEQTAKVVQQKQEALMKIKEKKEIELDNEIQAAIKAVALENKIDTVVDYRVLYFGGVDITDKVIKKLNTTPVK